MMNPVLPDDAAITVALSAHPESRIMKKQEALAIAGLHAEKAEAMPWLSMSGGWTRDPALGTTALSVGVAFSLPLWDQNQGNIQAGEQLVLQAQYQLQAHDMRRMNRVKQVMNAFRVQSETVLTLQTQILPDCIRILKELERFYAKGLIGIFEILEARSELLEKRLYRVDAQLQRAQLAADLLDLAGLEIDMIGETP